jgi:peroxiredoxin (alkyl hydroperoxide reductase subunit C)
MPAEIGQPAPDFSVPDQDGNTVSLADFKGEKAVALVFYPFTFTGVCEGELCRLRDDYQQFEQAGVQVLAISCNAKHAQKRWADEMGYTFPVLSDFWPHGAVAQAYGVFNDALGCANRATFMIDRQGTIVDVIDSPDLGTPREAARYDEALTKLAS